MIHHLKGRLTKKTPTYAIIECNGVGYMINISLNTHAQIGNEEECMLLTHLSIKEDAHILYGFKQDSERQLFRQLISVNGVGTSTAQMILSSLQPAEIIQCIQGEDVNALKSVKGIGTKTAQRIIIDLKDKVGADEYSSEISSVAYNTDRNEALSALVALGFDKNKAGKAIDKLVKDSPDQTVEGLIKGALKML